MHAFHLFRREAAEHYLLVALLSFAASVSLTRLFLTLTGYPQISGGELHIAHVLWGGLLLFAAALLPLILANRWVYTAGSLLAGVGVGLFIDEVGKFITQRNDYFYPAAAPIIYTFFLLTVMLFLHVRRLADRSPYAELHQALDDVRQLLEHPIKAEQRTQLQARLDDISRRATTPRYADLARSLLKFVEGEEGGSLRSKVEPWWWADLRRPGAIFRIASREHLRILLIIGILVIGLLTLKNPAQMSLGGLLPTDINNFLGSLYAGRHIDAATAPVWFGLRLALELTVGSLLVVSACLLAVGRVRQGCALGYIALLLSLTTVNLLLFYFEQFSTIITTTTQFLLLFGILHYRQNLADKL
jgi:hypothetical protein